MTSSQINIKTFVPDYWGYYIVETFLLIHNKVISDWRNKILLNIPDSIRGKHIEKGKENSYTSFNMGFYPMCLAENSGAN